jgi:hypothetical protein
MAIPIMGTKQIKIGTTPPKPTAATNPARLTARVWEGPELDNPMTIASRSPSWSDRPFRGATLPTQLDCREDALGHYNELCHSGNANYRCATATSAAAINTGDGIGCGVSGEYGRPELDWQAAWRLQAISSGRER